MSVVVVGAGLAGATAAAVIKEKGYTGRVVLVGDEHVSPYQRPPLSKHHLRRPSEPLPVRPPSFWEKHDVELVLGARAVSIDRHGRTVRLADDRELAYEQLILATGAANLRLPGAEHALELRTVGDAAQLQPKLRRGARLVIVGAGFIGMEVAAVAVDQGVQVTVVEAADRVMGRVISRELSAWFEQLHREAGVRLITGQRVDRIIAGGIDLADGEQLQADAVLLAVGVTPNTELASGAGLEVDDGILVDVHLRTADEAVWAIGDCARFPMAGAHHRLESVQNAMDQARSAADGIMGVPNPYFAVPWFWSEQFGHRLQIAGVASEDAGAVWRGTPAQDGFSVCRFTDGRLVAVESVDCPGDHLGARELLSADGAGVTPEIVADPALSLKDLATSAHNARPVL